MPDKVSLADITIGCATMQSIFSEATRRTGDAKAPRRPVRGGSLKMYWAKPRAAGKTYGD